VFYFVCFFVMFYVCLCVVVFVCVFFLCFSMLLCDFVCFSVCLYVFCKLVRFSSRGGLVIFFFLMVSLCRLCTWLLMSSNR
jgi:hypothetical protein